MFKSSFSIFGLTLLTIFWLGWHCSSPIHAEERQAHGLRFERWVRHNFFDQYIPDRLTQKWDVPPEANHRFGRIPVTIKASKIGTQIDLGDALRQFDAATGNTPFLFIVGFWEPSKKRGEKTWVHAVSPVVTPEQYLRAWHPVTRDDLARLESVIKDRSLSLKEARQQAHQIKSLPPFNQSIIKANPKLDVNQRRLQCSISYRDFFEHLAPDAPTNRPEFGSLFDLPLPSQLNEEPNAQIQSGSEFNASSPHLRNSPSPSSSQPYHPHAATRHP